MRILYINPLGTEVYDEAMFDVLSRAKRPDTQVELVSLPAGRPTHVEYHSYEATVVADIVRIAYHAGREYDGIIIGCFYDIALREAREVSGKAVVTAPCQSATAIAANLGNTFSVLVGRRKWIPKMKENVRLYGHEHRLASMRPLGLGVSDFQVDHGRTCDRLLTEGRRAVEEDGAEVLILGCTAEFGFSEEMQVRLGVPVIDAVVAPLKYAEFLAEMAERFGLYPSRAGGSEAPPLPEHAAWGLFDGPLPIGSRVPKAGTPAG